MESQRENLDGRACRMGVLRTVISPTLPVVSLLLQWQQPAWLSMAVPYAMYLRDPQWGLRNAFLLLQHELRSSVVAATHQMQPVCG